MTLRIAISLASLAHAGQTRIGGAPFIVHPMGVAERVADAGFGSAMLQAAWLHDVVEDGALTVGELADLSPESAVEAVTRSLVTTSPGASGRYRCSVELLRLIGFSDRVVELVDLLTRREGETYRKYIERVSSDADAARLKLIDIDHNTSEESTKHLSTDQVTSRERRYEPARRTLATVATPLPA